MPSRGAGSAEFSIALPETDENARRLAERLLARLARCFREWGVRSRRASGWRPSRGVGNLRGADALVERLVRGREGARGPSAYLRRGARGRYSGDPSKALTERRSGAPQRRLRRGSRSRRSARTASHSLAVSRYCELIGAELGFSEQRLQRLRLAGLLHDIGKVDTDSDTRQARTAVPSGVGSGPQASGDGGADPRGPGADRHSRVGARSPRAARRPRLSAGIGVDPARGEDPRRGGVVRRDDQRAPLRPAMSSEDAADLAATRAASSTVRWSTRWSACSTEPTLRRGSRTDEQGRPASGRATRDRAPRETPGPPWRVGGQDRARDLDRPCLLRSPPAASRPAPASRRRPPAARSRRSQQRLVKGAARPRSPGSRARSAAREALIGWPVQASVGDRRRDPPRQIERRSGGGESRPAAPRGSPKRASSAATTMSQASINSKLSTAIRGFDGGALSEFPKMPRLAT